MKRVYTAKEIDYIKKKYPIKGVNWVAAKLGKTAAQIKCYVSNNKIGRTDFYISCKTGQLIMDNIHLSNNELAALTGEPISRIKTFIYSRKLRGIKYNPFTEEQIRVIEENYTGLSNTEIAAMVGKTADGIKAKMAVLGLKRNKEQLLKINQRLNSPTWFKKGHQPGNTKHDGAISTRVDSHGNPYLYIRVLQGYWEPLHRHNWSKINGPVPEEKILRAKDGNSINTDAENWELIDRAEHLSKNSGRDVLTDAYVVAKLSHRQPEIKQQILLMPELIELKRNQIKLKRTINELT